VTLIEYESRNCTPDVQNNFFFFGGGGSSEYFSVQSNINIFNSPQPASSHIKMKLCLAADLAEEPTATILTQSVRYQYYQQSSGT
jgi:hypothetical protein